MALGFIDVWNLQDKKDIVLEIWNEINLYEKTRGINRFIGLLFGNLKTY